MSYADYKFYNEQYCGNTVTEDDFPHYEKRAVFQLGRFLGTELSFDEITDEVRYAVCEICDILCETDSHSGIEYERNDGYWVSYESGLSAKDKIKSCVHTWLSGSGLLYRGARS